MTRLLDEERGQIACLLTLGYSPFRIIFKYLLFALIGTLIGGFGAYFAGLGLAKIIYDNFEWNYTLPPYSARISMAFYLITFAVILIATLAATAIAGFKLTSREPADLLRPKTPKAGKKGLSGTHSLPLESPFLQVQIDDAQCPALLHAVLDDGRLRRPPPPRSCSRDSPCSTAVSSRTSAAPQ